MRKRFRKLRRDYLVGRVVANGITLNRQRRARAGVDATIWPDDCAYLDSNIAFLERRRAALLSKLKED